ncbi:MAG: TonB-dependent receptor, partial [Gammaproteobacteria bacterium]|nr:TonB-dependent receptor [Gammaproteobacteria bacterium]
EADNLRWVTGLYYLDYDSDIVLDVGLFAPSAFLTDQVVETDSWSVFGQAEWDFTDDLTVIAGLRYLNEEKQMDASGSIAGFIAGLSVPRINGTLNPDNSPNARVEEEDVAGKIQLNWQYSDNLLLYAGISRGVKAGGFNAVFGLPDPNTAPYSKETPITYEAGFKSTLLNGRAQWNTSLYYYDYQDYQAFAFLALQQLVFNTDAEVYGVDSNLLISPTEGLDLNLGINIMDTEAKNVGNPAGFVADRRLPNAPEVQFTGMARYQWPLVSGTMAIQGDFSYQSQNSFIIYNDPANTIDGYIVGNARLSWTSGDERWGAALFVKNIGNEEYIVSISNNASFADFGLGHVQRFYGRPRWVGGQVTFQWQ